MKKKNKERIEELAKKRTLQELGLMRIEVEIMELELQLLESKQSNKSRKKE